MSCSNPLRFYPKDIKSSFKESHADYNKLARQRSFGELDYFVIPCRECLNCRIDRQNEFVDRAEYEYIKYGCGAFVTFTYDDVHLFKNSFIDSKTGETIATINKKDGKDFLNRLNKLVHMESDKLEKKGLPDTLCRKDYKYVLTSEYGDKFNRPHFHALFFGLDFAFCERLFWKAWNYQGAIQVGAIKNGGIAYCVKYISSQTFGSENFYKFAYHHLESPNSTHSIGFGEGLYKSQIDRIKKTGNYLWHNKERPCPTYYKNKFRVISDFDFKKEKQKFENKLKNINIVNELNLKTYVDYKNFAIQQANIKRKNAEIKLQQSGKKVYKPNLIAQDKYKLDYNHNRLNPNLDNLLVRIINPQGKAELQFDNKKMELPLTNRKCMIMKTSYNQLVKHYGYKITDSMFSKDPIPF